MSKKKKDIDTSKAKTNRIFQGIENMEYEDTITPTRLAKDVIVHPDKAREEIDVFDAVKNLGFEIIRDKNGKAKLIKRTKDELILTEKIDKLGNEITLLKNLIQNLKR